MSLGILLTVGIGATTLLACAGEDVSSSARVLVAGPSYTGRCDEYPNGCDGANLGFTTAAGIDVDLSFANLMVLFGMARDSSSAPAWATDVVPGHDAVDDFATDGGIVELPGSSGYCTVAIGSRLCDPCRLRSSACDDCYVPESYVGAWLDGEFVQWQLDLNADVGPFPCDVVPGDRRWFILEIRPRSWFEGVTRDMLDAHEPGNALVPGDPLYDVLVERVTGSATFATLPYE